MSTEQQQQQRCSVNYKKAKYRFSDYELCWERRFCYGIVFFGCVFIIAAEMITLVVKFNHVFPAFMVQPATWFCKHASLVCIMLSM